MVLFYPFASVPIELSSKDFGYQMPWIPGMCDARDGVNTWFMAPFVTASVIVASSRR